MGKRIVVSVRDSGPEVPENALDKILSPFYRVDDARDRRTGGTGLGLAIVLDVMLTGMNGFDVLRELRKQSTAPVLMLTALGDEPDRIAGLEVGADEYLPKTLSTRELLARLRAVLRRSHLTAQSKREAVEAALSIRELWIDPTTRSVSLAGAALSLTAVEYDLLLSLARSAGRVKSRDQLLVEVADRDCEVFDRSIDVHISSLRKKLGDDPKNPRYIETVRSVGYRMKA